MKMKTAALLSVLFSSLLHPAALEFLNMSVVSAPDSVIRRETQLGALWANPAALAELPAPVTLGVSVHSRAGLSLLSGALAARLGPWAFAAGAQGLLTGRVFGDQQFAGDAGRELKSGCYSFAGCAAFGLGEALRLPVRWNLAVGAKYGAETLDEAPLSATLLQLGMQFAFHAGSRLDLGISMDGRNLPLAVSGIPEANLPALAHAALFFDWKINKSVAVSAAGGGRYGVESGLEPLVSVELRLLRALSVRAEAALGAAPSFVVGAGVRLAFQGSAALSIDLAHAPGDGGATLAGVSAGIGELKAPAYAE